MKEAIDKKGRREVFKAGDEVVLTKINLQTYCLQLQPKIKVYWVRLVHGKYRQMHLDWMYPLGGESILASMLVSYNASPTQRNIYGKQSHRLMYSWGMYWSIRSRGFYDT